MRTSDRPVAQSRLDLDARIRRRAHEIWESRRDRDRDTALQDWLEAEREILDGDTVAAVQSRANTVGDARKPSRDRIQ